jgi:type I restriction enzyme S subunit
VRDKVTKKLGDIAEFINGGAWSQTEYADSGIPVVRVSDIHDCAVSLSGCKYLPQSVCAKYAKHELREGDLVICTIGSHPTQPNSVVGRPGIMSKSCEGAFLNQNAVCIRPLDKSLDKRWLGYFARSQVMKDYIIAHSSKTTPAASKSSKKWLGLSTASGLSNFASPAMEKSK